MADVLRELVKRLLVSVAHADGAVSSEEFHLLYHRLNYLLPIDGEVAALDALLKESEHNRDEALNTAILGAIDLQFEDKLFALALGYDFAAVDGLDATEDAVLENTGRLLGVPTEDLRALRNAVCPHEDERPTPASAELRYAHIGGKSRSDFPLVLGGVLTVVGIGRRQLVRIDSANGPVYIDEEPALLRGLQPLSASSQLLMATRVMLGATLLEFLDVVHLPWLSDQAPPDWLAGFPPNAVRIWRRGTFTAIEALQEGVGVNRRRLRPGTWLTVLPGDRIHLGEVQIQVRGATSVSNRVYSRVNDEAPTQRVARLEGPSHYALAAVSLQLQSSLATKAWRATKRLANPKAVPVKDPTILDDISIRVSRRELVAILGASGSGKTTLLEVMAGMKTPSEGDAEARFENSIAPIKAVKESIALVPQDEIVLASLTVQENVSFAATIRSDKAVQERAQHVSHVLGSLGLSRMKDRVTGSPERRVLSGGQRRRLGVAIELMSSPDLLLLDEPLSGLSSQDARNLMTLLVSIARQGPAVVVVVHQPSSELFHMFDSVIVVDTGGKLVYTGSPSATIEYFGRHIGFRAGRDASDELHPDVILAAIEQRRSEPESTDGERARIYPPSYWQSLFKAVVVEDPTEEVLPRQRLTVKKKREGFAHGMRRMAAVLHRHALLRWRNAALPASLVLALILGSLIAVVLRYYEVGESYTFAGSPVFSYYLYLIPIVAFFFGVGGSGAEFLTERRLIQHEARIGLSPLVVLFSKVTVLSTFSIFEVLLFITPGVFILDIPSPLFWLVGIAYLVHCVGVAAGLLISSVAPNLRFAFGIIPFILIPQIVFGGLIPYDEMSPIVRWPNPASKDAPLIAQLMPSRWASEGLMVSTAAAHQAYWDEEQRCEELQDKGPRRIRIGYLDMLDEADKIKEPTARKKAKEKAEAWKADEEALIPTECAARANQRLMSDVRSAQKDQTARAKEMASEANGGQTSSSPPVFLAPARALLGITLPSHHWAVIVLASIWAAMIAATGVVLRRRT